MTVMTLEVKYEGDKFMGSGKERKVVNILWRPHELSSVKPFIIATERIALAIKNRVVNQGRDHHGARFSKYQTRKGKRSISSLGRRRIPRATFRVPEPYPMPSQGQVYKGFRAGMSHAKDQQGKKGGRIFWAYYIDRFTYQKAIGQEGFKNFYASGGMWKGLMLKAMAPNHVRVYFGRSSPGYRRKKGKRMVPNREKAKSVVANEKKPILEYSLKEAQQYEKFISDWYSIAVLKRMDDARTLFEMRKLEQNAMNQIRTFKKRLSKAS